MNTQGSRTCASNVRSYLMLRMLGGCGSLAVAGFLQLLQSFGLSLTQVLGLQAIFSLLLAIWEIPSGYFADRFGRRCSILVGLVAMVIGLSLYSQAASFHEALLAEAVLSLGLAFGSGADVALLYDSLQQVNEESRFLKLKGLGELLFLLTAAGSAIVGGVLASYNVRLPFAVESVCFLVAFVVACHLREVQTSDQTLKKAAMPPLKEVLRENLVNRPEVRWLILFSAVILSLNNVVLWFYPAYYQRCGFSVQQIGLCFALMNVVAAIASALALRVVERIGRGRSELAVWIAVVGGHTLFATLLVGWSPLFAVPQQWARGFGQVVFTELLNSQIASVTRATVLSIRSMFSVGLYALLILPLGIVGDTPRLGVQWSFGVAALLAALFGGVLLYQRPTPPQVV